jgi:cytochrome c-type biogenesis protein CcmH
MRLVMRTVLAAVLVLLCLAGSARAVSDPAELMADPKQEMRAEAIGQQLRCLVCQNESIEESDADLARDLRGIIRQRVAAGDGDQQVIAWMTTRYGNFVRLRPPFNWITLVLWGAPALALGSGAAVVLLSRRMTPPEPLGEVERQRLAELLEERPRT